MRPRQLIVTATGNEEKVFFKELADVLSLDLHIADRTADLGAAIRSDPASLVVWDLDRSRESSERLQDWNLMLKERCAPEQVFVLCDEPGQAYTHAFVDELPFTHAIRRRLGSKALQVLRPVLEAAGEEYPLGLERYFPEGAFSQSIKLKKSDHRGPATEAMQSFLQKRRVKPRVAAAAAQAVDELLMNAIFNAPHDARGNPTRRSLARGTAFDLHRTEYVELEVMACDSHFGIRVTDPFGRLERDTVMRVLSQDYRSEAYVPKLGQRGAGLGLRGILGFGLSLLFVCKPGARTDAMVFWPTATSHVEFKRSFQFVAYFGRPSPVMRRILTGAGDSG